MFEEPIAERSNGAIGIHLGSFSSCVATWSNAAVDVIRNDQGFTTTPSIVAFTDTETLVGQSAKSQFLANAANRVFGTRDIIGKTYSEIDEEIIASFPFEVVQGEHDGVEVEVQVDGETRKYTVVQIHSMILAKMQKFASDHLYMRVRDCVIAVPCAFNDQQRIATKDAAKAIGLNPLRIISESTAIGIAYAFDKNHMDMHICIVDVGGATTNVTLMNIEDGIFEVLASVSDIHLGGNDFDNEMVKHFISVFKKQHGKDISTNPKSMHRLRLQCQAAKCFLSSSQNAHLEIDALFEGIDFVATITRAKFEALCGPLLAKITPLLDKVMREARLSKEMISDTVLAGGSTRIPRIQAIVKRFFNGKEPLKHINPDEVVAHGTAIQAAILSGGMRQSEDDIVLLDVTPLSLGVGTVVDGLLPGGTDGTGNLPLLVQYVIPRNTTVPVRKSIVLSTCQDNQTSVQVEVFEGERALGCDCNSLARVVLDDIPAMPRGVPQIEVVFEIDANGILVVKATELSTQKEASVRIDNDSRLALEDIERMVSGANLAEEDQQRREVQAQNERELTRLATENDFDRFFSRADTLLAHKLVIEHPTAMKSEGAMLKAIVKEARRWRERHPDETPAVYAKKANELLPMAVPLVAKLQVGW